MRKQKTAMLLRTIELCAASHVWRKLPAERRVELAKRFTRDREKVEAVAASAELPLFESKFGGNWYRFVQAVVSERDGPVVLTDVEVMDRHNARVGAQYTVSEREVRGRVIHNEKGLGIHHAPGGKLVLPERPAVSQ